MDDDGDGAKEDVGAKAPPDQPGGGAMLGLLTDEDEDIVLSGGRLTLPPTGGGAMLREVLLPIELVPDMPIVDEDDESPDPIPLLPVGRRPEPVWEGVSVGVRPWAGVELGAVSRSSQDITSSALPPTGISRATCPPFADPTNVAKSTSPDAVNPEPSPAPTLTDDPAT